MPFTLSTTWGMEQSLEAWGKLGCWGEQEDGEV